jgi:hypothetical protein
VPPTQRRPPSLADDRASGLHELTADPAVADLQVEPVDGGQELVPFQLFQNIALRRHGPPDEGRRGPDPIPGVLQGGVMIPEAERRLKGGLLMPIDGRRSTENARRAP